MIQKYDRVDAPLQQIEQDASTEIRRHAHNTQESKIERKGAELSYFSWRNMLGGGAGRVILPLAIEVKYSLAFK